MSRSIPPASSFMIDHQKKRAAAKAMAAHSIFLDAGAIVGKPPSSFKSYFNAVGIDSYLKRSRMKREHLRDLKNYFDWDKLDK